MVFFHAVLLLIWGWFATALTGDRLVALLSLVLLASSPTLMLWTPQPESRLVGLPAALAGIWLLLRLDPARAGSRWTTLGLLFVAGSLFGLAQAIRYNTSLYLILPVSAAFWAVWLRWRWRRAGYWLGLLSFGIGCLWLQALREWVSYAVLAIPWEQGPTAQLLVVRDGHHSPWGLLGNLSLWSEYLRSQMGLPLLAAIAVGWAGYVRGVREAANQARPSALVIGLSVPLGLAYLGTADTMPFFRQTSVLQPFLFLFAGLGIVYLASRFGRRQPIRWGAAAALLLLVGAVPWGQAHAVFRAHQGLGRALEWAHTHKGDRELRWLRIAWFEDKTSVTGLEELEHAPPDTWLISYYPWDFVGEHPSLRPYQEATPPLASWPSLYATDAMRAELKAFGYNDFRFDPLLGDVRVAEVASLLRAMEGRPLHVESVTADSLSDPSAEPINVFDRDASPDGASAWVSADTPMPHALEVRFAEAVPLGELRVVLPPKNPSASFIGDRFTSRVGTLEVQVADERDVYRTVWFGQGLERYPTIAATWEPLPATGLRVIVHRQTSHTHDTGQAIIEELAFPGYRVVAPKPERSFPELVLRELRPTDWGFNVSGANVTRHTVLALDGTRLPTRQANRPGELLAVLPDSLRTPARRGEAYLTDGFRRSNARGFTIGQSAPGR
jgi:hypothetical protein